MTDSINRQNESCQQPITVTVCISVNIYFCKPYVSWCYSFLALQTATPFFFLIFSFLYFSFHLLFISQKYFDHFLLFIVFQFILSSRNSTHFKYHCLCQSQYIFFKKKKKRWLICYVIFLCIYIYIPLLSSYFIHRFSSSIFIMLKSLRMFIENKSF